MKPQVFLLFFSIVISIYSIFNLYIYKHAILLFKENTLSKKLFIISFVLIVFAYFIYRVLERIHPTHNCKIIGQVGSLWLAMMIYLIIFLVIFDIFYFSIKAINGQYIKQLFLGTHLKYYIAFFIVIFSSIIVIYGFNKAGHPIIKKISLKSEKKLTRAYRFVYISDLHINDLFFNKSIEDLVKIINENAIDFVLFGGDVFTEDVAHLKYHDSGEYFKLIKAKYGTYTVFGNHEYIGGIASAVNHFKAYHFNILADSVSLINDEIIVIGRDDLSAERFNGKQRRALASLIDSRSDTLFSILIDHQPASYKEGKMLAIDLFLSGHTHNGQMYPFSLITKKIFDNSWGLIQEDNKYYYTSSGYGFWGPPVRIGSNSEIIIFSIGE